MGIILDSSILIAAEKQRFAISEFFSSHSGEKFYLAAVTAAELLHGVERAIPTSRKAARSAIVEHFLQALEVIDYDLAAARTHATIWATLAKTGSIIGPYDMLIAASALTHGHKLATLNQAEFKHVAKLKLVDVRAYAIPAG